MKITCWAGDGDHAALVDIGYIDFAVEEEAYGHNPTYLSARFWARRQQNRLFK
jgi:hypothetical protein